MQNTKRDSLNIPVARRILQDIAAGTLKEGARVSEISYAERCGVSRTPVRQALLFLQKIKALSLQARLGARVKIDAGRAQRLLANRSFARNGNVVGISNASIEQGTDPAFVEVARRVRNSFKGIWAGSALLSGEHNSQVLKDSVLARELGVSRTTANRALALLARENLIEPLPRRGWRRVLLGPRQIVDLYDFRMAIEPAALSSAWEHLDREKLSALLERTRSAASANGIRAFSPPDMAALDLELHHAILQACPNRLLQRAMEEQEALRVISVAPAWRAPTRSAATFQEHVEILESILSGTREAAIDALKRHLLAARDDTAARVKAIESGALAEDASMSQKGGASWLKF